jgi:ADP-heptose:LPS heptosyltransferase
MPGDRGKPGASSTPASILVLRRDNIGDLVCTTPLLAALRAQLPGAWLGALVTSYNAEVLQGSPALDEVFVYEKMKHRAGGLLAHLRARRRALARVRERAIDCVLVPAPSPRSLKLARSLRPARVLAAPALAPARQHEVERSFETARPLGLHGEPGPLQLQVHAGARAGLQAKLGPGPFAAIHISARRPAQRWPLSRYAALAARLAKETRVLLLWAPGAADDARHPGDDAAAAEVLRVARDPAVLPVATPDLRTLIAALSLAERVVCPDGGAMHIAAALGRPVVALFGDSPVERWRPWRVPHRVLRPDSRDLADLALEPVLEAVASLK